MRLKRALPLNDSETVPGQDLSLSTQGLWKLQAGSHHLLLMGVRDPASPLYPQRFKSWRVVADEEAGYDTHMWLAQTRLLSARFTTRKEAIEAVGATLAILSVGDGDSGRVTQP